MGFGRGGIGAPHGRCVAWGNQYFCWRRQRPPGSRTNFFPHTGHIGRAAGGNSYLQRAHSPQRGECQNAYRGADEGGSKPDRGVVTVESKGFNQDGKEVCFFRRKVLVWKREFAPQRARPYDGQQVWDA